MMKNKIPNVVERNAKFVRNDSPENKSCENCGRLLKEHYFDNPDGNIYCYTELTSKEDLIFKRSEK